MSSAVEAHQVLARAREVVSSCTGFRDTAISPAAVDRVVRAELARGRSAAEMLAELKRPGSPLARMLLDAVLVGETYFFRHPEQFRFMLAAAVPAAVQRGTKVVRAWSAGCASGEETYSIAACLLGSVPPGTQVEVLGTDLHEGRLEAARRGVYGNWSRREAGPVLYSLYDEVAQGRVSVRDSVRAVTRFAQGNLLEPLSEEYGRFDVIFCRNVLTYFAPDAVLQAVGHLARALVPGGYLLLGTVEVDHPPAGLVRVGPPELQAFRRPLPHELLPPKPKPAPPPEPPRAVVRPSPPVAAPPPPPAPSPVNLHTEALHSIEGGDERGAAVTLEKLLAQFRDYLPGMLELALLRERAGARDAAFTLMQTVRDNAARLPPDQIVEGPEPLPARFYRASADAFLTLGSIE